MIMPIEAKIILELANEIIDGDIDKISLICPYCKMEALIFSFTLNKPPRYGLFIDCKNCGHRTHFSIGAKPKNFRKELVLAEYQHREEDAMRFSRMMMAKKFGHKLDRS